ncbi:MAG: RagB/SusD family nutrient uptake outer membrane protein [Bacteroidales bacterium]|nr:RagB/SusD family nutrient uptake outer membrane protein [Bacteroidales bacterium]
MKNLIYIIILTSLVLFSCEDWMDIQPKSEVDQVDLFSSEEGYMDALNGVYLMLGEGTLYGDRLTMSFLDILAQNYFIPTGHSYMDVVFHNYETEFGENQISGVWNKAYNVIANCNNIIDHLNLDDQDRFSGNNYKLIKGEALTIRAHLHFDLLRMFNAPYVSQPDFLGIPYVDEYKIELTQQSTTQEALALVLQDLKAAYELLQDDEVRNEDEAGESYRENRFNYYASAALLARVYLYMGDHANAAIYAQEVIDAQRFEWMKPADVIGNNDYVFYPELIMGLYSVNIGETARDMFKHTDNNNPNELICSDRSSDWYDGDDIRFKYWFEVESTMGGDKRFMVKYNRPLDEEQEKSYQDPVLPLIKLPEMYLILAECKGKSSLPEGISVLNEMRTERRAITLDESADESAFAEALAREYEREFYGEGQLFYFYKRMNYPTLTGMDGSNLPMDDVKYTLPLPADEVQFGGRVTQ